MKSRWIFLLLIVICYGCSQITPEERLRQATDLLAENEFDQVLTLLHDSFATPTEEEQRCLLRGLTYTWKEQWDLAKDEFNRAIEQIKPAPEVDFIYPESLRSGQAYEEFRDLRFSEDDMRYLWRVLWQRRIAERVTGDLQDPMEKTIALCDYVYRHIQFGIIEGGYCFDKPFHILIRGQGLCDELAWELTQLLRAVGLEALRLVLYRDPSLREQSSPHTLAMVKIGESWLPVDPTLGVILKNVTTGKPEGFPQNFLIDPVPEDVQAFGDEKKPIDGFLEEIKSFGQYEEFADAFYYSLPAVDYEVEAHTPRFLLLAQRLKRLVEIPALAVPFITIGAPELDPDTKKIINWVPIRLNYIYQMTQESNAQQRQYTFTIYRYLLPIREARLALLAGDYERAEQLFSAEFSKIGIKPLALEDYEYYIAVSAYEQGRFEEAEDLFHSFLEKNPHSNWMNRAYYQLALLAWMGGDQTKADSYVEKCGQNHEGGLFRWVVKLGLVPGRT